MRTVLLVAAKDAATIHCSPSEGQACVRPYIFTCVDASVILPPKPPKKPAGWGRLVPPGEEGRLG